MFYSSVYVCVCVFVFLLLSSLTSKLMQTIADLESDEKVDTIVMLLYLAYIT